MGAEGAVNIIFRKEIAGSPDTEKKRAELVAQFKQRIDLDLAAQEGYIDDVIDPVDTRRVLIDALERCENKQVNLPKKKRGVLPV